jgi:ABC-type nitrate/sulfonate/bicarbonate transport system substrate-binding protein
MKEVKMKKEVLLLSLVITVVFLTSCQADQTLDGSAVETLTKITFMLDWVPNTNHTGIFVAQTKGYFTDAGLEVEIVQPGEVYAEQAVISGVVDFGISFQEQVTLARADDIALVSIAAVIQHNTSGFASRAELDVVSPKNWEGLRYGSFGSPFEEPTLQVLMECDSGNFSDLEVVNTGFADPLALLDEDQTDLAWIFFAWQGVQADLQGIELNVEMMEDWFDCVPDYYTPVIITSEATIEEKPEIVSSFLSALSKGYEFAITNPSDAAEILLESVPELDETLVRQSQEWLSPRYQAEAARWGEQQLSIWEGYSNWMAEHNIIPEPIEANKAFTNAYLP